MFLSAGSKSMKDVNNENISKTYYYPLRTFYRMYEATFCSFAIHINTDSPIIHVYTLKSTHARASNYAKGRRTRRGKQSQFQRFNQKKLRKSSRIVQGKSEGDDGNS